MRYGISFAFHWKDTRFFRSKFEVGLSSSGYCTHVITVSDTFALFAENASERRRCDAESGADDPGESLQL